jgi:aminoacrylate peracid reductase
MDIEGKTIGVGDASAQCRAILESIKSVVESAGGTMDDVVYNAIFLKDLNDYAAMNIVYKEYFSSPYPARYCIRADLVKTEFLVEISSTAHLPKK